MLQTYLPRTIQQIALYILLIRTLTTLRMKIRGGESISIEGTWTLTTNQQIAPITNIVAYQK